VSSVVFNQNLNNPSGALKDGVNPGKGNNSFEEANIGGRLEELKNPPVQQIGGDGKLFIGIDIAKQTHCARAVNSLDDRESEPLFFANRKEGIEKKLLKRIAKWCRRYNCNEVVIAVEPTAGYWRAISSYLESKGFRVELVASKKVKSRKDLVDNSPLKSDKKDALLIARLLKQKNILDYREPSDEVAAVKELVNIADDLNKTLAAYKNRLEYFTSVYFPEIGDYFGKLGCKSMRTLLHRYPFPREIAEANIEEIGSAISKGSRRKSEEKKARLIQEAARNSIGVPETNGAQRVTLSVILSMLDVTEDYLATVKSLLKKALEKVGRQFEVLDSIKGVGVMVAGSVIAALGDLKQYRSNRQVLKKVGLNLYRLSSGNRHGRDHISRRGMALARKYLFMAARCHTREGTAFYGKYISMRNRGVSYKKTMVAIMRKLLRVMYALVRDDRMFEINYDPSRRAERNVNVIKWAKAA